MFSVKDFHAVIQIKKTTTQEYVGGLANARGRMDRRWYAMAYQWDDDDPLAPELTLGKGATATPHPISVYTKLNHCQAVAL